MKSRITKNSIANAFMKLLTQRPFEKITVRDIVEECGLTRNTFYYYYQDTYDIVDYILTREINKIIESQEAGKIDEDFLDTVFSFVFDNPKLMYHLFKSSKRDELDFYFKKAIGTALDNFITRLEGDTPIPSEDRQLILTVVTGSIISATGEWAMKGPTHPLRHNLKRSLTLFRGTIEQAVENSRRPKQQKG